MAMHYFVDKVGNVILFDPEMFVVERGRLYLNERFTGDLVLPENVTSIESMFENCDLTGVNFKSFNTSKVQNMKCAFAHATFPEGFKFPDDFSFASAVNTSGMFKMSKGYPISCDAELMLYDTVESYGMFDGSHLQNYIEKYNGPMSIIRQWKAVFVNPPIKIDWGAALSKTTPHELRGCATPQDVVELLKNKEA